MTFNPYHQWLGLDPRWKNPHYFQLLGVSSKVLDELAYANEVQAAAQAKLELLKSIAGAENSAVLDQVRQRILRAAEVLADSQRRSEYVQNLKLKNTDSRPPVVADSPIKKPTPRSPRERNSSDLLPPMAALQSSIPLAEKIIPSESSPPPRDVPQIPMAIPIQKPLIAELADNLGSVAADSANPEWVNEVNVEPPMRLKPVRKRRTSKLGLLGAISMILITVISVAGLYFIIDRLANKMFSNVNPTSTGSTVDVGADPSSSNESTSSTDSGNEPSNLETIVKEIQERGLPEETDADRANVLANDPAHRVGRMRKPEVDSETDRVLDNTEQSDPGRDATETGNDAVDAETSAESVQPARPLTELESLELVSRLRQIRRSMFRRDRESVSRNVTETQRRIDKLLDPSLISLNPSQQRLRKHFEATKSAVDLLDGFWAQVVSSSLAMEGGQEISLNEQTVGFVEGTEEYVILRVAGSNINFRYEFLPPGLAVKIAEIGAINDVPSWRMSLAAFLGLQNDPQERHADRIEELIAQSVADGHDDTLLREFLNDDFSDIAVATKLKLPSEAEISELLQDFQTAENSQSPTRVKPQLANRLANRLMTMIPDTQTRAIAYLYHARELATQAGNAFLVEDATSVLADRADVDRGELLLASMLELSKNRLDATQSRNLMETAIPVLKSVPVSAGNKQKIKELAQRLNGLAETHQFLDAQRRISQLNLN